MSKTSIKVAALLCFTLVVQGNKILEEYQQDIFNVEENQNSYSDYSTDYFGNSLKYNFEMGQFQSRYHLNHFREMYSNWFWTLPKPVEHSMPSVYPKDPGSFWPSRHWFKTLPKPVERPIPPSNPKNPGSFWPNRHHKPTVPIEKNPKSDDKSKMCQNIKGLPKPESGCCGVQVMNRRQTLQKKSLWPEFEKRFRRSTRNQPPVKMIKGGHATQLYQLPWLVRLLITPLVEGLNSAIGCGGTIISSRYILTAAHCFDEMDDLSQIGVMLAEYDIYNYPRDCITTNGKSECFDNIAMKVDDVILHEEYNNTHLQNDVALIKLSSDIPYNDYIRPICLPTADIDYLKENIMIIAGWGSNGTFESNLKQAAFVEYVSDDKCKEQHSYKDDSMFCSIGKHGEDIRNGDSGGPLMVLSNNKYFLSGIANGKREGSKSSLFNNVFYHKKWIIRHVK